VLLVATDRSPVLDDSLGGLRLREIGSFVVLAQELHFARAARHLRVSTGGLSRRIAHLERALGARLLTRTTRSVMLTEFGHTFLPRARRLVHELEGSRAVAAAEPVAADLDR
jgi:DNA-binding transcriptional LysR family regulator